MNRSRRRRVGTGLTPLLLAALLGAVAGLWTWTRAADPSLYPAPPGDPGVEVHILDNGFHTDLAVPRAALARRDGPLADAVAGLAPGDWILIGWGDAVFYVDQTPMETRLPDGLRAFFHPGNASVIMLDPEQTDPRSRFATASRRSVRLSSRGFEALAQRLEGSLAVTRNRPRLAVQRPGDDARFFASREFFWIGHLCNHWTAGLLGAGGLPVRPLRAVTSAEVMATVERAQLDRAPGGA